MLYIAAAALPRLSLNPLVLMDGPVKASQDAGNRITANRILDHEEEEEKKADMLLVNEHRRTGSK